LLATEILRAVRVALDVSKKLSVFIFKGLRYLGLPPKHTESISEQRSFTAQKNANPDLSTVNF
jgi:hypothetical protein